MNLISKPTSLTGEFAWEIVKKDTGVIVKKQDYVPNIILNNIFDKLSSKYWDYLKIGTGNSTPNPSQTGLDNYVKSSKTDEHNWDTFLDVNTKEVFSYITLKASFSHSSELNLTELGLSDSSNTNSVVTRALFKDSSNNPITITLRTDEILHVYYRLWKTIDSSIQEYTLPYELTSRGSVIDSTTLNIKCAITPMSVRFGSSMQDIPNYPNFKRIYIYGNYPRDWDLPVQNTLLKPEGTNGGIVYQDSDFTFLDSIEYIYNKNSYYKLNSTFNTMLINGYIKDRFENGIQYYKSEGITYKTNYGNFTEANGNMIYGIGISTGFGFLLAMFKRQDNDKGIEKTDTQTLTITSEFGVSINRDSVDTIKANLPTLPF